MKLSIPGYRRNKSSRGKQITLFDLRSGNWFRLPRSKERYVVTTHRRRKVGKRRCISLSFGYHRDFPEEIIVIKVRKS